VLVDATADLTIGLILAVTRRIVEGDALLRAGTAWSWSMGLMLGRGLQGKRLGLVGYGRIAKAVDRRAEAFGMQVVHSSRTTSGSAMAFREVLRTSDVISLHCPLNAETFHLIDSQALAAMQPHAYLINTARGPIVDEAALVRALADGQIAGAGLDVFENEPAVTEGLAALANVVLTPHLGSATTETREAMALLAARNVLSVLRGSGPLTPVVTRE
jgi:glyoxylate reductase